MKPFTTTIQSRFTTNNISEARAMGYHATTGSLKRQAAKRQAAKRARQESRQDIIDQQEEYLAAESNVLDGLVMTWEQEVERDADDVAAMIIAEMIIAECTDALKIVKGV